MSKAQHPVPNGKDDGLDIPDFLKRENIKPLTEKQKQRLAEVTAQSQAKAKEEE